MAEGDADMVRQAYGAWNDRGSEGLWPYWHEQAEWHDPPELPDAGVARGRDEVSHHLDDIALILGPMHLEVDEFEQVAPDEYLVLMKFGARGSVSGAPAEGVRLAHLVRVRDGRVDRIRAFFNIREARAAVPLTQHFDVS
ncbi:MAG: nuclear transport factor 2 family protein [Thermoleophilaceae bacterium]